MTINSDLIFVIAAIMVVLVVLIWVLRAKSGVIRIDQSNPKKDVYRLDIDDLEGLVKKKYILLKVDPKADLSQR